MNLFWEQRTPKSTQTAVWASSGKILSEMLKVFSAKCWKEKKLTSSGGTPQDPDPLSIPLDPWAPCVCVTHTWSRILKTMWCYFDLSAPKGSITRHWWSCINAQQLFPLFVHSHGATMKVRLKKTERCLCFYKTIGAWNVGPKEHWNLKNDQSKICPKWNLVKYVGKKEFGKTHQKKLNIDVNSKKYALWCMENIKNAEMRRARPSLYWQWNSGW